MVRNPPTPDPSYGTTGGDTTGSYGQDPAYPGVRGPAPAETGTPATNPDYQSAPEQVVGGAVGSVGTSVTDAAASTENNAGNGGGGQGGGGGGGGTAGATDANPQNVSPSNPYIETITKFIDGSLPRNTISTDEWAKMLEFAKATLKAKGIAYTAGEQPLELFALMFQAYKMGSDFKDALHQGVQAGVWNTGVAGTWNGYVYNDNYAGAVGSGAAGAGTGATPPPAGGGTHWKANLANWEVWAQNNGLQWSPEIAKLAEEDAKKGWNQSQFLLDAEQNTKAGGEYLQQQTDVKVAGYEAILNSYQMSPDSAKLQALMHQAAVQGWSTTQFQQNLYDTPEFQKAFPGIFNKDGSLKMDPSQYLTNVQTYKDQADRYGLNMNDQRTAWLFRNNVSPQEFADRAQAVQVLRDNQQYFHAFNAQLKALGEQPLSKGDQFRFIMGEGNAQWYQLWNQASTRYAAQQSGVKIGGGGPLSIGEHQLENIAGKGFTESDLQKGFADLAHQALTSLPESRYEHMGVTKRDLIQYEFGGPRSAAITAKLAQIGANIKAYQDYTPDSQGMNAGLGQQAKGFQQTSGGAR